MIAYLEGTILKKNDRGVILKTGEIGYQIHMTEKARHDFKEGAKIELFIHHVIKEDASDLYGFADYHELELFKTLIQVNGVGPKVAGEILNAPAEKVKQAIVSEDIEYLRKIPGIGPKTAKRIVFELMGKIDAEKIIGRKHGQIYQEAIEALGNLGYQKQEILDKMEKIPQDLTTAEEIITNFLKYA